MTATRPDWREIDAIFTELLDVPESRRAAVLAERCGHDPALHAAVERLLAAERRSAGAFSAAAGAIDQFVEEALRPHEPEEVAVPERIRRLGPYLVSRLLGRGGMASVWLADRADGQFEKTVAIKILRQWIDGEDGLRRFLVERQILSSLTHPNIVPLLDGGTADDGTPWLATEYIEGEPITDYCEARGLGVEARLDLFLQVIDAVHHAHQKLIVHRDLKPSNILVDAQGRVRLLDFGIAKLLENAGDPRAQLTRTAYRPMTPEYAAPEQFGGGAITTATDIYQLGVLLYELLAGQRPPPAGTGARDTLPPSTAIRRATDAGMAKATRRAALRLARRLQGDLDLIVLKALQEDPERRYPSAAALAEDIRNHLRSQPISARPESALDTLRRFFRRRPWAGVATALAGVLIFTGAVAAVQIAVQRDNALREAQRANQVSELLLDLFRQTNPWNPDGLRGRETTVWESVDAATARVREELQFDDALRARMLGVLADLHFFAGRIEESAGLLAEVAALYRGGRATDASHFLQAVAQLARQQMMLNRREEALATADEAERLLGELRGVTPKAQLDALLAVGDVRYNNGQPADAERLMREAQALAAQHPEIDPVTRFNATSNLAQVVGGQGRAAEAAELARAVITAAERELGDEHVSLFVPLAVLGNSQRMLGQPQEAVASLERGLAILEREYGPAFESTVNMRNNLVLALAAAGHYARAHDEMVGLIAQQREQLAPEHPWLANALLNLAVIHVLSGQYPEALAALDEMRVIHAASLGPEDVRHAFPLLTEAFIHLRRDDPDTAARLAQQALAAFEGRLPETHFAVGVAGCLAGEAALVQGRHEAAATRLAAALPVAEAGPGHLLPYLENCRTALAAAAAGR
jgi:eukaryotic-like serine/threonine-protein kinase